jgi:hypothetical protein
MATKIDSERPTEASPQRSGGWLRQTWQRIKLAMSGNDEELVVKNETDVSWHIYRDYHNLGIVDPKESRTFTIQKSGMLNVRPLAEGDSVDYLVLQLNHQVRKVRIYR